MTSLKKYSFFTFAFAFILGFSISTAHAQVQEETTQTETYMLTGKVVDATSGEALADVKIKVKDPKQKNMGQMKMGEEGKMTETTNEQGEFTFTELPSGQHTIMIDYEGYETWERNISLNQDSQLTIELQPSM